VREYFAGLGLGGWLVESARLGEEGSSFQLRLKNGGGFARRVLHVSRWGVDVFWQEIDGVLAFTAGRRGAPQPC